PEQEREQPPVRQALVRANPVNGRKSIYIGSHAWYVEGMDYDESRRLLDELLAHTTRSERVYAHRWRQWDLVMWDNRCVLHRGWRAGERRREPLDPDLAARGVAHGLGEAQVTDLLVFEHLPHVQDRPRRHACLVEDLDPLGARFLHEHTVELGVHLLAVLRAV